MTLPGSGENLGFVVTGGASLLPEELDLETWDAPGLAARSWRGGGALRWYVVAEEAGSVEALVEELHAHVGAAYSTVVLVHPESTDVVDASVRQFVGAGAAVRIDVNLPSRLEVARSLGRFARWWRDRPSVATVLQPTTADVLREYRLALGAGLLADARRCIETLRGMDGLNAINIGYLDLEVLHAAGDHCELLEHPLLEQLLGGGAPVEVRNIVADSVVACHLRSRLGDAARLVWSFAALPAHLRNCVTTVASVRRPSAALVLALDRVVRNVALDRVVDRLFELAVGDTEIATCLERLIEPVEWQSLGPEHTFDESGGDAGNEAGAENPEATDGGGDEAPPANPVAAAIARLKELETSGQIDELIQFLPEVAPTVESLAIIRSVSFGVDDVESLRVLAAHVAAASDEVWAALEANAYLQKGLAQLRARAASADAAPSTWAELLARLATGGWDPELRKCADGGAEFFPYDAVDDDVDALCAALAEDGHPHIDDLVPALLGWSAGAPEASSAKFRELDQALLFRLCLIERSAAGRVHALIVADRLLRSGLDAAAYEDLLESLESRWEVDASPDTMGWFCEVIELLLDHPGMAVARAELVARMAARVVPFAHRIRAANELLARGLLGEYGLTPEVAGLSTSLGSDEVGAEAGVQFVDWSNRVVGLYSLDEGVLGRAKLAIERLYSGIEVLTNHDKVATDSLRAMAQRAQVMVIAWKVAKHPATEAIEAARPGRAVERALGGGSSSMIAAAEDALRRLGPGLSQAA